jgi:CBS domain-containing protein
MRVSECMSREVRVVTGKTTLREAALAMSEWDTGALPVADNENLAGMVTDRDIAIRGVAQGKGPDSQVWEVMTGEIHYCHEDDEVEDALAKMGELQVRRLPVLNKNHNLVGIVSLADLSLEERKTGEALQDIARPGGDHSQSAH